MYNPVPRSQLRVRDGEGARECRDGRYRFEVERVDIEFKATLEELDEASLLVHVVDITSPHAAEQCQTVEGILVEMKLADKPRITTLNKIDVLLPGSMSHDEKTATAYLSRLGPRAEKNTVLISA